MNDLLENKMSRATALQAHMRKNESKWNGNATIVAAVNELDGYVQKVQDLDAELLKSKSGITSQKSMNKEELIKDTLKVQAGVLAYASSVSNIILLKSVSFPKSRFEHTRDTVVYDMCKVIYDTAEPIKAELVIFMVVQADLDKLSVSLLKYEQSMQSPRGATSETKTLNANLKAEVNKIDLLIRNKMNYLMLPYRAVEPDFYNTYKTVTMIIDLGKRKEKGTITVKGKVIDFESEEGIANARVWVEGEAEKVVNSKADGNYELVLRNAGTIVILAEKENYYQAEESLDVEEKNVYEVNIELEKVVGEVVV